MPKVAVFCDTYLPGYKAGGPIPSIARIIEADAYQEFRVVTRDRDLGDLAPYPSAGIQQWQGVGRAQVAYLRPGMRDQRWLVRELHEWRPDFYYINSLHSPHFGLAALSALRLGLLPAGRLVLAPRGETSTGALGIKPKKKVVAKPLIRRAIGHQLTWHVSSESEKSDVCRWWGRSLPSNHNFVVRPDLAISPAESASVGPPPGTPPIVEFASRIDRMKGLDAAINLLREVRVPYVFRVDGAVTDAKYWQECRRSAGRQLPAGRFNYAGTYKPYEAQGLFSDAAFLLLPTLGENFGHVISEALSVGCPVLIPDTTIWTPLVEAGAGLILKDPTATREFAEELLTENFQARQVRRASVLNAYRDWFTHEQDLSSLFGPL